MRFLIIFFFIICCVVFNNSYGQKVSPGPISFDYYKKHNVTLNRGWEGVRDGNTIKVFFPDELIDKYLSMKIWVDKDAKNEEDAFDEAERILRKQIGNIS